MSPCRLFDALEQALRAEVPVALATVIEGPHLGAKLLVGPDREPAGSLGDADLDRVAGRDALGELESGTTVVRHYGEHGEAREQTVSVFIESFAPPPQMLVFGAVDFTKALVRVAKVLGYRVTVCDAREVFATRRRFPQADEVVVDWPHRLLERVGAQLGPRDAICVLTHDHKFDVPAIVAALAHRRRLPGGHGQPTHPCRTGAAARGRRASTRPAWPASWPPSGSTSGPAPRRRRPSRSAPRSSPCAPVTPAPSLRDADGAIHR